MAFRIIGEELNISTQKKLCKQKQQVQECGPSLICTICKPNILTVHWMVLKMKRDTTG